MQGAGASQRRSCRARVQAQAALLGAQQLGFVRIWRGKVSSRPGSPLQWAVARRLTRNPNDRASPTGARACKHCAIEPRARSGRGRHGAPNSFILRTGWRQHASSLGKPGDGARPPVWPWQTAKLLRPAVTIVSTTQPVGTQAYQLLSVPCAHRKFAVGAFDPRRRPAGPAGVCRPTGRNSFNERARLGWRHV